MIQARDICLSFGEQKVFDHISFTLNQNQRIGLVGRNGSGKSTLLKVIAGQQRLDEGSIAINSKKVVAYMPQEVVLESDKSILDETLTTFEALYKMQQEAEALELCLMDDPTDEQFERYADLQGELAEFNVAKMNAQAQRILIGLGFKQEQFTQPVAELSVGWKMRVVLAKLLLKKADFYLFDEPTNHLDIIAKDWFLDFLKSATFGFLLVSHERYFLDTVCTEILEIERANATFYNGGYSKYEALKAERLEHLSSAYEQQKRELKSKMETIERFKATASKAKMAQSMLKSVDKIERITMPPQQKTMSFNFPPIEQPGKIVLEVDNLGQKFGDKQIFTNATFQIERGEKVGVIAPNGVGKSTLFNIIIGQLPRQQGSVELGYNVKATIFAQDQTKSLDVSQSVLQNAMNAAPKKSEAQIRSFLGAFLFSNDDVHKKVKVLSGGEKNRVGMVCVLLQDANFLLLDEPTNHLDLPSKETLLTALQAYKGTILFVSHDHDFINHLANRIIELTPNGTNSFQGNYESYLYQKKAQLQILAQNNASTAAETPKAKEQPESAKPNNFDAAKQSKKLEGRIEKLEKEIAQIEHDFAKVTFGTPAFNAAQENLQKKKAEHKALLSEWESLQDKP